MSDQNLVSRPRGRPRAYPDGTKAISLTLSKAVHERLSAYAESEGVSRSRAATRLVEAALSQREAKKDPTGHS